MHDLSRASGSLPDVTWRQRHAYITPAYFAQDAVSMELLNNALETYRKGRLIGKAVLMALDGETFHFNREILDKKTCSVTTVEGEVSFRRIAGSADRLLYSEGGFLTLPGSNQQFEVSQHYIFTWDPVLEKLVIYFSKVGQPNEIDHHFLTLSFSPTSEGWQGKNEHLCGEDNYLADYLFPFQGLSIPYFKVTFDVSGPSKDYQSTTHFMLKPKQTSPPAICK